MGRKSSIERLPKPIKDRLGKLVRDGRLTLDQIVDELRREFGQAPSRSAVGRFSQKIEAAVAKQREMETVTEVWVREFKDNPTGKMGRMVHELLRTIALQAAMNAHDRDTVDAKEIRTLAQAFNLMEAGGKRNMELERQIRDEVRAELLAEQEARLDKVVRSTGLSAEMVDALRRQVLGVA